jgi:hypothetical protein
MSEQFHLAKETFMSSASGVGFLLVLVASMETAPLVSPFKMRRSTASTATDGSDEADSGCDDGSDYGESDYNAKDDEDW